MRITAVAMPFEPSDLPTVALSMKRLLVVFALALSCGGPRAAPQPAPVAPAPSTPPAPVPQPQAVIVGVALVVSPAEADVYIDDVLRGDASTLDPVVALEPGLHRLAITHEGYKPYRVEFSVSDKTEAFAVRLEPVP